MSRKKIKIILTVILICILFVCISTIDNRLKSNVREYSYEKFEEDYFNIIENYSNSTDGQIVISNDEGLYEQNGCYMIDGNTFARLTGVSVKSSDFETNLSYENRKINIKDNTISNSDGDVELLSQEIDYYNGGCAFPIQSVSEALGYNVSITSNEEEKSITLSREFSTKRLIVKYEGNIDNCGAVASAEGFNGLHIFQYADEKSTASAYEYYKGLSYIDYVEIDEVVTVEEVETESTTASVSSTYRSWGAEAMGVASYTNHILNTVSTLPEIIVAVIDTGIDTDHEWFANRIASGGKDFTATKSSSRYEYEDDQGHGTHVSGIIVDLTMSNVKILPIKVMDASGKGYTSGITLGVQYVTSLKKSGAKIKALNMSLGGQATTESNKAYSDCLSEANNNGIVPVVAAGNENTNVSYVTPANVSCAITVAALANANNMYYRPYYSNFGSYVDVCAPGSAILSARMGGGTISQSGTSMAAPHVAAALALIFTEHQGYTNSEVEKLLKKTAIDLGTAGKDSYYGEGMVSLRYIYAELLSDVTFNPTTTECTSPFDLTLFHTNSDASIYYTLDGSFPTPENGILYSAPVRISRSVKIRASAYILEGGNVTSYSNPEEKIYRFGNQDLENCFIVNTAGGLVYYQGILENLTVPQTINGVTIKKICSGAFTATNVVNVVLPNTVTEIESSSFRDCKNIQTVTAPKVKTIGNYAFQGCSKFMYLTDTYFPELTKIGAYAFYQCEGLRDIALSKVEVIDSNAFYMRNTDPKYLKSINLPSAKIISDFAFNYASYVTQVNLPKVEIISECAFQMNDIRNLYLPKAIYLGTSAFFGNNKLAFADLPEAVYLSTYALAGSAESGSILSSVNLPKAKVLGTYVISHTQVTEIDLPSVETLLPLAFYTQRLLTSFTAPNLKYVGSRALGYCEGLTEINLPSVISLDNAFYGCKNLQKITLSPCLEHMPFYTTNDRGNLTSFRYVPETCVIYYYKGTIFEDFYKTTGIKNPIVNLSNDEAFTYIIVNGEVYITGLNGVAPDTLVIPSYIDDLPVTKICEGAFEGCSSSIKLNVLYLKEIEENAFKGCTNLTEVYLTRINTIGAYAFRNCTNLKNVTIENIIEIGAYAFNGCTNLKQITLPNCITSIGEKALGFASEQHILNFVISGEIHTLAYNYAVENWIEFKTIKENVQSFYYNTYFNGNTGNEEIVITLVDTQTTGNIIIPESYNGMTISAIDDEAFSECLVTSVTLPTTITEIGMKSFQNCHFLESINLDNILTIGQNAFYGCQSLKYVYMPLVEELPIGVFSNCSSLKIAELSGVIEIGQDAFNSCYELEKVICPNLKTLDAAFNTTTSLKSVDTKNVVTITGNAFIYSKSIEELYFPNLESITAERPFSSCPSLKKVFIGKKFKNYVVDSALDLESWTYYNVPIYSYAGSKAEEWALKCLDETKTKHWDFIAIDDIDTLTITKNLSNSIETEINSDLALVLEAEGIGLTYQWFTTSGTIASGTPIQGATGSKLIIDTTSASKNKYFVKITDWMDATVVSQICEVTIEEAEPVFINVTTDEHIISLQNGNNTVSKGISFKVTFTVEAGYHISQILVDGENLSDEELSVSLLVGYEFTNVLEHHTIEIISAPNEDTVYTVYHYKHSLKETLHEINGKYYDLQIEKCSGTTGTTTMVVPLEYEGFTAGTFFQKEISGNGDTFITIFYNRNTYIVTLVDCDGVTVEGSGTYFYGEKVIIKAILDKGFEWDRWESSNPSLCPNSNNMEYSFTMPTENLTLTAYVIEIPYTPLNIVVTTQEHVNSSQSGSNIVDQGESFKVTFTVESGYHITQIIVDEIPLTEEEFSTALLFGYEFTNIIEDHTIEIASAPNEDTIYTVYHYKQSLVETSSQMNGKYYEREEEILAGTTGTTTAAEGRTYEGFTMEAFEQSVIDGSGDTIISILYNRNIYSVTLIGCDGVIVEGEGNYLYGQSVLVKAVIEEGYEWKQWESSNFSLCPNTELEEYAFLMPASDITLEAMARKKEEVIENESFYINVTVDEHVNSLQSGNNKVNQKESFKIIFTAETGYHVSQILIDENSLTEAELSLCLQEGYEFTNVVENHTIKIITSPNENTIYTVYHYKQSLTITSIQIKGKYYELEEEILIGTTESFTTATSRDYDGFTVEDFEQYSINGNGLTIVPIFYSRKSFIVVLSAGDGITITGGGSYLYGQIVNIKAEVASGYEGILWESSNTKICPNEDMESYSFSMPAEDILLTANIKKIFTPAESKTAIITVALGEHIISSSRGSIKVNKGESINISFTADPGYHISQIIVDSSTLNDDELKDAIENGYSLTNITENHTIRIMSSPNEDTTYTVYHYKESLIETSYVMNGKYYDLEEEKLMGTTESITSATSRSYEGFTANEFKQKIIEASGETSITILYHRNSFTISFVGSEGVTVEGDGTYIYGQTVVVKATVTEGYIWLGWENSNPNICPNTDTLELAFSMPAEDLILTAIVEEFKEPDPSSPSDEEEEKIEEKNIWLIIAVSVGAFNILIVGLLIWYIRRKH